MNHCSTVRSYQSTLSLDILVKSINAYLQNIYVEHAIAPIPSIRYNHHHPTIGPSYVLSHISAPLRVVLCIRGRQTIGTHV